MPESKFKGSTGSKKDEVVGKAAIQRAFMQMKRQRNMSSIGNKFMAIVKKDL